LTVTANFFRPFWAKIDRLGLRLGFCSISPMCHWSFHHGLGLFSNCLQATKILQIFCYQFIIVASRLLLSFNSTVISVFLFLKRVVKIHCRCPWFQFLTGNAWNNLNVWLKASNQSWLVATVTRMESKNPNFEFGKFSKRMCAYKKLLKYFFNVKYWRHGIVVIESAYKTEDPRFESRQGVRFTEQCCCQNLIWITIVCTWEK
jgi:hypothetical protein